MTDFRILFISEPNLEQLQAIVALYRGAGWWPDREDDYALLARLVRQSHCFAVAIVDERIIGMGRAISDGVSDAYVQDVTVAAAWQRSGVGTGIVWRILDRLKEDGINWVGLIAECGSAPFYGQFGFEKMLNATPMVLK